MPKIRKPRCHGFSGSFSLSKRVCDRQNLNETLIDVPAKDWCCKEIMAAGAAYCYYNKNKLPADIRASLVKSFDAIGKLGNQRLSVQKYAQDCRVFWKDTSIEDFNKKYQDACNTIKQNKLKKNLKDVQEEIKLTGKLKAAKVILNSMESTDILGDTVEDNDESVSYIFLLPLLYRCLSKY